MAQMIRFDDGIKEYQINNNGVLRMNPGDPNLYDRFFQAQGKLLAVEKDLVEKGKAVQLLPDDASDLQKAETGSQMVHLLAEADIKSKEVLNWVFPGNNFDRLLGGVNCMAVAVNGERVITNLMDALAPIITEGAKNCADIKADAAVAQAKKNRAQRRAENKQKGRKE